MSEGRKDARNTGGFATRHRFMLVLLWAHVPVLAAVGLVLGEPIREIGLTSLALVALAVTATVLRGLLLSAGVVALGLVTASGIVIHYSGGVDVSHFHLLSMVCVVSFYRDRRPLVLAVTAATVYHYVVPAPTAADPMVWASLHSGAVIALALLLMAGWRLDAPGRMVGDDSGDRYRMSFEEAPIGMAVLKPSGDFLQVNRAMTRILGYDQAHLFGTNVTALVHGDDRTELGEAWEKMGNSSSHTATEWMRWLTARGRPIWGRASLSLVPWRPDRPAMVILQIEDVTHTHEEQRRLEDLIRGKDEFVAAVGDEIRRPLGRLIDLTDLANHPHVDTGDTLPRIEAHAKEISSIVEDLVVSARADTTPVSVVAHRLDAETLCRNVLSSVPGAEDVSLDFRAKWMWADPALTRQIVNSLLINAIRYGGPEVELRTVSSGPDTVIEVRDNGPEIPADDRDRVFSGDLRNGQPVTRPATVGLGLTVGRHLARQMDGDIEYRRTSDGENVFELRLPSEQLSEIPKPRAVGIPA